MTQLDKAIKAANISRNNINVRVYRMEGIDDTVVLQAITPVALRVSMHKQPVMSFIIPTGGYVLVDSKLLRDTRMILDSAELRHKGKSITINTFDAVEDVKVHTDLASDVYLYAYDTAIEREVMYYSFMTNTQNAAERRRNEYDSVASLFLGKGDDA